MFSSIKFFAWLSGFDEKESNFLGEWSRIQYGIFSSLTHVEEEKNGGKLIFYYVCVVLNFIESCISECGYNKGVEKPKLSLMNLQICSWRKRPIWEKQMITTTAVVVVA